MGDGETAPPPRTGAFKLDGIDTPTLRVQATMFGAVARVTLAGEATSASKVALDVLLRRLHARCVNKGVREVTVDMLAFDFMDSSCFKAFVTWVSSVRELDPASHYRMVFVSNAKKHWQERSLRSLACFAIELVTIQSVP